MDSKQPYDVIIVGGGIMGSTTAFYLTLKDPGLRVAVIERDLAYTRASTTLSMVNARIQFSLKQNVRISQYAFDVLERFEDDMAVAGNRPSIAYHREGNLFLHDPAAVDDAKAQMAMQQGLGCQVEWWTPDQIKARYPLYAPEGFAGGTFGGQDGHFDAYAVLMAYKANARAQGAVYIEDEVVELMVDNRQLTGVRTLSGEVYTSSAVVNCAGAWCTELARTAGVALPVDPVKRQCFCVDTAVKPEGPLPLTILPSGFYFRTETGGMVLIGKSLDADPVGFDFTWDQNRFMDELWLELAEFVPAFERLKLVRGWAGLYAVNRLDDNAILGEWPELKGFYLANGFSGHGLQQGPAVGRYMSELILGETPELDLSIFHPRRILEGKPIGEVGIV
ncbi:glycine/D-amino acid oxidase [Desulfosarcina alkanivorans]|uniref:Glycine/D-amino acid oxidase n=1 Tax=Desulfosarcina alkanivorans TaxID=571177 RepID=A0A5K7YQS0_9BACT|nr:FAD-binding oxidoreductase [Desulfosarcina alkanivorans]BBO70710.1 glycine/D-amino acid oxidase [Desulfosarcina alkanivorans]